MVDPRDLRPTRRDTLRLSAASVAAVLFPAAFAQSDEAIGEQVPEIETRTNKGLPLLSGRAPWPVTYLDFWASWCSPCRLSFPWMNEMHDRYAARGLRIVGINLDRHEADALLFLRSTPARFELLMDPTAALATLFDIKSMPSAILVTAGRRVAVRHRGFSLHDGPELERRIVTLLARA